MLIYHQTFLIDLTKYHFVIHFKQIHLSDSNLPPHFVLLQSTTCLLIHLKKSMVLRIPI